MRVLAATTAGAGHFAGLLPFALACRRAGHEVRVAAPASFGAAVAGAGLEHVALADADAAALGAVFGRIPTLSMREADDLVIAEVFGRLDRDAALPGMRDVVDGWRPDVVLREPAELASYVAATERGIPHVQTSIGVSSVDDRMLPLLEASLDEVGCTAEGLRFCPRWTTVPAAFDEPSELAAGDPTRARDPAAAPGGTPPLPAWWPQERAQQPLVYVTFGSVAASIGLFPGLYVRALEQLADVPARILLTLGEAGDPADLGRLPSNVHVEQWWPQRDVMPHADVLVGHGGFGTTMSALVSAVPQVVLPLFSFDQFVNARRVAAVGAGVALVDDDVAARRAGDIVPSGPPASDGLAAAVADVLRRSDVTAAARAVAADVAALPDVEECVAGLHALAG